MSSQAAARRQGFFASCGRHLEAGLDRLADLAGWLVVALVPVLLLQILAHDLFGVTSPLGSDLPWQIASAVACLGFGAALIEPPPGRPPHDARGWTGAFCRLLLVLSFALGSALLATAAVAAAWVSAELSGWLPGWVVRAWLPLGFMLAALAAFATFLRRRPPLAEGAAPDPPVEPGPAPSVSDRPD